MNKFRQDWDRALDRNSISGYYYFLNEHPNSEFSIEARRRLEYCQEEKLYNDCAKRGRAYEYIQKFPNGRFINESIEIETKVYKENRKIKVGSSLVALAIWIIIVVLCSDAHWTYNGAACLILKLLLIEVITLFLFNVKEWYGIHIAVLFLGVFMLSNFTPRVVHLNNGTPSEERRALFYVIKDKNGEFHGTKPYSYWAINNCPQDLTLTTYEYIVDKPRVVLNKTDLGKNTIVNINQRFKHITFYKIDPPHQMSAKEITMYNKQFNIFYRMGHRKKTYAIQVAPTAIN